jgi:hypothetical protein
VRPSAQPPADDVASPADTLTDAPSASFPRFVEVEELEALPNRPAPTTGPQAAAGSDGLTAVVDELRSPWDERDEAGRLEAYHDDRSTLRMFEVTANGAVPVPLAPSRPRDCRGRSHARQPRQRPRGAGRPRVRRTASASRAGPGDDSDSDGPGEAGHLSAGNRGRCEP